MTEEDKRQFAELISDVSAFYRQDCNKFAISVWWEAMRPYDFEVVNAAMGRHARNPDNGQYMPKPADVVKMLEGTTMDKAVLAWADVERAISRIGPYESVEFADPRCAQIVTEMGGWVRLCQVTNEELPFRRREFENRYRSMVNTNEPLPTSARVAGLVEMDHARLSIAAQQQARLTGTRKQIAGLLQ